MIEGRIDENLEARVTLRVLHDGGYEDVQFLIDTGFNGFLAIPISLVQQLNFQLGAVQSGITADGRTGYFDTVALDVLWHEVPVFIRTQMLDEPLIGTRLLRGNELTAEWVSGGPFRVSPLPRD